MVGCELRTSDFKPPLDQLHDQFVNWRMSSLSHMGRVQLVRWMVYGKLNFWFQRVLLPKGVLDTFRKIIYAFVWEGRKGIGWWQMMKTKENEVIDLKDLRTMDVVVSIKNFMYMEW